MIIRLTLAIFIAIIVAVTLTYTVNDLYKTHSQLSQSEKLFYSQKFEPEQKKIFLIGSSHIGRINATLVENNISTIHKDYKIYNLGIGADTPSSRINHLQKTIESKPVLVVYGVTFLDLKKSDEDQPEITDVIQINKPDEVLPEPWVILYDWVPNKTKIDFSNLDNQQKITLNILNMLTNQSSSNITSADLTNTPFFKHSNRTTIINDEDFLKKNLQNRIKLDNIFTGYESNVYDLNTKDLEKIILELKKNNIKVILLSTPLSRVYLDTINDSDIEIFKNTLQKISKKYNIPIHHFYDRYSDMNVWSDISHVAINKDAEIFSNDIANIILDEIDQ